MIVESQKARTCIWILFHTHMHCRTIHRIHTLVYIPTPVNKIIADRLPLVSKGPRQLLDSLESARHWLWQSWAISIVILSQCPQRGHLPIQSLMQQVPCPASWLLPLKYLTFHKHLGMAVVLLGGWLRRIPSIELRVYSNVVIDPPLELEFLFRLVKIQIQSDVSASWTLFLFLITLLPWHRILILHLYFFIVLLINLELILAICILDLFIITESFIYLWWLKSRWW